MLILHVYAVGLYPRCPVAFVVVLPVVYRTVCLRLERLHLVLCLPRSWIYVCLRYVVTVTVTTVTYGLPVTVAGWLVVDLHTFDFGRCSLFTLYTVVTALLRYALFA